MKPLLETTTNRTTIFNKGIPKQHITSPKRPIHHKETPKVGRKRGELLRKKEGSVEMGMGLQDTVPSLGEKKSNTEAKENEPRSQHDPRRKKD